MFSLCQIAPFVLGKGLCLSLQKLFRKQVPYRFGLLLYRILYLEEIKGLVQQRKTLRLILEKHKNFFTAIYQI